MSKNTQLDVKRFLWLPSIMYTYSYFGNRDYTKYGDDNFGLEAEGFMSTLGFSIFCSFVSFILPDR